MRRFLLDQSSLEGPHAVRLRLRPLRFARPVPQDDPDYFLDAVTLACQLWGGAGTPLLPVASSGRVASLYAKDLRGADVDGLIGADLESFNPDGSDVVDVPPHPASWWGLQFAPVTIAGVSGHRKPVVACVDLAEDDPWRGIYAACLGRLPVIPDPEVLHHGRYRETLTFADLIDLRREEVAGSAADLLSRLASPADGATPRAASMHRLAYGSVPHSGIRSRSHASPIPRGRYWAMDAGPNILVVCTPGNVDDLTLLWILRVTHGDSYGTPLGVLDDSFTPEFIEKLLRSDLLARQGIAAHSLYVTSCSVGAGELAKRWNDMRPSATPPSRRDQAVAFLAPQHLVDLGPAPGRHRQEVATWAAGRTSVVPIQSEDRTALSWSGSIDLELRLDVDVIDSPFPRHPNLRTGLSTDFFAGTTTRNATGAHASPSVVDWPDRMLMLRAVVQEHNLTVEPSAAGVACTTLLNGLETVWEVNYFAHGPLLQLFDELAARSGTAWAKAANRSGQSAVTEIAPTIDDLPDVPFQKFHRALGVKIGPARAWMAWAERRRLIVKGFPLRCERCAARQWVPISGYRPPISCVGCAQPMEHPFPTEQITFTYRLGEVLRRVYEHDAMGHLLTLHYLAALLEGGFEPGFVGVHPGLDFTLRGATTRLGESDMLLLQRDGSCIPGEVKRSFGGVTPDELSKLDALGTALEAPWDVLAVTQYARDAPAGWLDSVRIHRSESETDQLSSGSSTATVDRPWKLNEDTIVRGARPRVVLTYDHLLDLSPIWSMSADPFDRPSLDEAAIADRHKRFAKLCEGLGASARPSALQYSMLYDTKRDP